MLAGLSSIRLRFGRHLLRGLLFALIIAALVSSMATVARAQQSTTLISNIGQTASGSGKQRMSYDRAQAFTTGSHSAGYRLTSVDVVFNQTDLGDLFRRNNPYFTVGIWNESGGKPGKKIGSTLTHPRNSPDAFDSGLFANDKTFRFAVPGKGIMLAPSTTYFFVIDSGITSSLGNTSLRSIRSTAQNDGGADGFSIADGSNFYDTFVNPPKWSPSSNSLQIDVKGYEIPITDFIQMSKSTRWVAEFGVPNDGSESLRIGVRIGDGLSIQSQRYVNYTVGGSADLGTDYTIKGCTSSPCRFLFPNRYSTFIPIRLIDDDLDENDETIILTLTSGTGYTLPAEAKRETVITLTDDDTRGLAFARNWPWVPEGESRTYNVRLASQPTEAVTVSVTSDNPDLTLTPTSLTFNPTGSSRWNRSQGVVIDAAHDSDGLNDDAILTFTPSGGDYDNVAAYTRPVSVKDDDPRTPGVRHGPTVSVDGGPAITEGSQAVFTFRADSAPTANLTVYFEVIEPPGQDFVASTHEGAKSIIIASGATSATHRVPTVDDGSAEDDGAVQVYVDVGTGYDAGSGSAVYVSDNDGTGPTATPTPIPTATPTPPPGSTPTPTPVATATPTPTPTPPPGATATPTPRPGATATPTPRPGATATPTPRPSIRPTATPRPRPGATATPRPSVRPTATPTTTAPVAPTGPGTGSGETGGIIPNAGWSASVPPLDQGTTRFVSLAEAFIIAEGVAAPTYTVTSNPTRIVGGLMTGMMLRVSALEVGRTLVTVTARSGEHSAWQTFWVRVNPRYAGPVQWATPIPTATPRAEATASPTPTATPRPVATATPPLPEPTATPEPEPTATATPEPTPTPSAAPADPTATPVVENGGAGIGAFLIGLFILFLLGIGAYLLLRRRMGQRTTF